jgi:hypothetical protein
MGAVEFPPCPCGLRWPKTTLDQGRAFFDFAQNEDIAFVPLPIFRMLGEVEARIAGGAAPLHATMRIAGARPSFDKIKRLIT